VETRTCHSALNRSGIPGADWCLNPYSGCTHACVYCYASFMKRFAGRTDPWGTYVEAKANIADVLGRELRRPRSGTVLLCSVTDAYQPAEASAGLTRACLSLLAGSGLSVSILTKSDRVLGDLDLLRSFGGLLGDAGAKVGFSVTTLSDDLAAILEPGAPPPSRRLAALEALSAAGIPTWVFLAPALPGIADTPARIAAMERVFRRHGAREVEVDPLNFYPASVRHLHDALAPAEPALAAALRDAARDPAAWRARFR
jgi:DNA repair photolyase